MRRAAAAQGAPNRRSHYKLWETARTIDEREYRLIVVHSTSLEGRKHERLEAAAGVWSEPRGSRPSGLVAPGPLSCSMALSVRNRSDSKADYAVIDTMASPTQVGSLTVLMAGGHRLVNAGSVGLQSCARGACWALIGPDVLLCETPYDVELKAERTRRSAMPIAAEFARHVANPPMEPP